MKSKGRSYLDALNDILQSVAHIEDFIFGMPYDGFCSDFKPKYAVIRALEVIGEATKQLPVSLKQQFPDMPWKEMSGMRDILIHRYFGVDDLVIWETVCLEIPRVKISIQALLKGYEGDENVA